jgi:excinuclease ABC subunit C
MRRASLLKHFGGLVGLRNAGIEEIARVEGVNAALARRIYASLHGLDAPPTTTTMSSPSQESP